MKIAKTHNELSVKPILQVSCIINRVNGYVKFDLLNKGMGPAIISELVYDFENKIFSNYRDFFETLKNRVNLNDTNFTFNHIQIFKHSVLSSNEEIQLGKIFIEPHTFTDSIARFLDNAKVHIKYKDVYDNEFKVNIEL